MRCGRGRTRLVIGLFAVLTWVAEDRPALPVGATGVLILAALELLRIRLPGPVVNLVEPLWSWLVGLALVADLGLGPSAAVSAAGFVVLVKVAGAARVSRRRRPAASRPSGSRRRYRSTGDRDRRARRDRVRRRFILRPDRHRVDCLCTARSHPRTSDRGVGSGQQGAPSAGRRGCHRAGRAGPAGGAFRWSGCSPTGEAPDCGSSSLGSGWWPSLWPRCSRRARRRCTPTSPRSGMPPRTGSSRYGRLTSPAGVRGDVHRRHRGTSEAALLRLETCVNPIDKVLSMRLPVVRS